MTMPRRSALSLGALTLAGCAPDPRPRATPPPTPLAPSSTPESAPHTASSSAPIPGATSAEPAQPSATPTPNVLTRDDVVARLAGRAPRQWGLEVDGVVLRHPQNPVVLTFDACGGPNGSGVDEDLLAVLAETETPATLFINARWAEANPGTLRDLVADPLFELANHGTRHLPLSVTGEEAYGIPGTASVAEAYDEVMDAQAMLTELLGEGPRFFRSGTAHYDDVAVAVVHALGLQAVNFDVNADAGATFTAAQVHEATRQARPGSICLGHLNRPGSGTAEGIRRAIADLLRAGRTFAHLGEVLPRKAPHPEG